MRSTAAILLVAISLKATAQTATVYRGGSLIGTYTTATAAALAATVKGDSILLSAHIFKEHNIPARRGQIWQGTMTATDTSTIDGEKMATCLGDDLSPPTAKTFTIRDIIIQNGTAMYGGGVSLSADSIFLRGHTIIRWSHATVFGGAVPRCFAYDNVKLTGNTSDSAGGAVGFLYAFDSVEISYNSAKYGGAIGQSGFNGRCFTYSPGVRFHHNTASISSAVVYTCAPTEMYNCQIYANSAPVGAALSKYCTLVPVAGCRIFNPKPDGKRQNEIQIVAGVLDITGTWLGQSDTAGLISRVNPGAETYGKHAICKWIINRGKPVTKADTLFPVDAVFTYVDGTPLPTGSLPWLQGVFTTSKGSFINPNPTIMPSDTLRGMYRAYTHLPGDTGSRSVSFVCSVDADTFRTNIPVWGKLTAAEVFQDTEIKIYPNPTSDIFYVSGLLRGMELQLEDITGKQLLRRKVQSETEQISLESYPVGSYMIHIFDGAERLGSQRIMKQ